MKEKETDKEKNKYSDLNIIYFDYANDLKLIVERYWQVILDYKMILDNGSYSDIQNGTSKQICHNSISLVLFIDGAHFNKNAEGVFWAFLGMVSNLPFTIRASSQNILKTLFINAKIIDFNKIIDKHLGPLKTLLSYGLWLESLSLNVTDYIHVLIADARM